MDKRRSLTPPPSLYSAVGFLCGMALVISAAAGPLWSLVGSEAELMKGVNEVRRERHLKPLSSSPELARVAQAHARDMAQQDYLSHVNPKGEDPLARVRAAGIEGVKLLAENIGSSSKSGDRIASIIQEWLASPVHRENVLNPAFNTTGVAIVETADGKTLAVQLYATF
jgi:uncharacterized protein YkwD